MQIKIFMESPAGDVKEVVVTDPNKDLVPLMDCPHSAGTMRFRVVGLASASA